MLKSAIYLKTNGGTAVRVYPIYGTDVALSRERESNQRYFRDKLEGTFTFAGSEYGTIYNGSLDTEYTLQVYIQDTVAGTNTLFGEAIFHKTDCEFDTDHNLCTLQFDTKDQYNTLLGGLDNEYNLVALAPERQSVSMYKRPILQIYFSGDSKLTNVVGNMSYEVDCNEVTDASTLTGTYKFRQLPTIVHSIITFSDIKYTQYPDLETYREYFEDSYSAKIPTTGQDFYAWNASRTRAIYAHYDSNLLSYLCRFTDSTQTVIIPTVAWYFSASSIRTTATVTSTIGYPLLNMGSAVCTQEATYSVYTRVLFDVPESGTVPSGAYERPADDILSANLNYGYVLPISAINGTAIETFFFDSNETQVAPTEYGVNSSGRYFVKPTAILTNERTMPVAWNQWIPYSYWFRSTLENAQWLDAQYKCALTIRDAYPLASAIQVLLNEICGKDSNGNPYVEFGESETYSNFLYSGTNPIDSGMDNMGLFITPITNVKKTYYEQAAQKGTMKLSQIFDMLAKCYQCYWFLEKIDSTHSRLRIEHALYFKNGGSYSGDARVVIKNLTNTYEVHNGKAWAFCQNTFKYDIGSLPNRYEFGWENDCTEPFEGYPLEVTNGFLKDNSTKSVKVDNFVSDVDYVIATPDDVTDDCYALLCANTSGTAPYPVPIASYNIGGAYGSDVAVLMQNAPASFLYLEQYMYDRDMPGSSCKIKDYYYTAKGVARAKVQEDIEFPGSMAILNTDGLITTGIGSGGIRKISLNLSSLIAKATLEYETN